MSKKEKVKKFFTKWLYPFMKLAKPYLKQWAAEKLIPKLQKKINAGAVDKSVDNSIAVIINEAIDQL